MFDSSTPGARSTGPAAPSVAGLAAAVEYVASFVKAMDPDLYSSADAARLVGLFARLETAAAAGTLFMGFRVASGNGWQGSGHRSAEEWLADQTGTTTAEAAARLRTAAALGDCPATEEAVRDGRLSGDQAAAVASAASADPSSEQSLLDQAGSSSVEELRKTCRQVRASATHDRQLDDRARAHAGRFCRTWTDDSDGSLNGRFKLTGDAGAVVTATLDAIHDRLFAEARAERRHERSDALHADALVAMARAASGGGSDGGSNAGSGGAGSGGGGGRGSGPEATIVIRVDHSAFVRGSTVAGEECSIDGTGPVPVPTARRLASDAVIAALLVDGDRICDVRLVGRTIPRRLRVALIARDRCCVVPGCGTARHLEIHHLDPIAQGGPTSLDNTCRICTWHHDQITYRGAHLARAAGSWLYEPGADDPGGGPFDDDGLTRPPPAP